MKVYISADIEGVTGIAHWDETLKEKPDYAEFRDQMTREVAAACRGAEAAGATEILVKDAHHTGRNLDHRKLPECVELIRGWSGHPLCMVQELEQGFDALMMVGYHSRAGAGDNPLAHTMTGRIQRVELNGEPASEFLFHAYAAADLDVPVAFVSGDEGICREVRERIPGAATVAVGRGIGDSTRSRHPAVTVREIEAAVAEVLRGDLDACRLVRPEAFELSLEFKELGHAYRAAQYPGMVAVGPRQVRLEAADYLDVLRAMLFLA